MEWLKFLLEAAIIFGATFAGVYIAIKADTKRELKTNYELKTKLVNGLYFEVKKMAQYFRDHPSLVTFQDYFIDTPIILETVKDQFYRLGKEFIGPMAELRGLVRRAMGVCQLWEKRNRDNTGLSKEKDEWSRISGNLRGEWNSLYVEAKVILETITKLLEKEGATPEK